MIVNTNYGEYMELLKISFRMFFFYFFIILIYRIMGKREVGQLSITDLIVSILIAELAIISVEDVKKSIFYSVVPIIIVVILQMALSYVSLKIPKLRTFLDGTPSFIIQGGKINYKEMVRQKYNLDDLISQLREKGYRNVEDIEYAILENNGTLSIFEYNKIRKNSPIPLPIILDGCIQYDTLKYLNKNEKWIDKILLRKKVNLSDIFYAFYKDKNIFIIKYSDLI